MAESLVSDVVRMQPGSGRPADTNPLCRWTGWVVSHPGSGSVHVVANMIHHTS